jgi:hypothetical protein
LRDKSETRVKVDTEFKKIQEDFAKAQKSGKVIKIAEILKDKDTTAEKQKKAKANKIAPKDEKDKEYLGRADIKESVNVLADLISLSNGQTPDSIVPAKAEESVKGKSAESNVPKATQAH